MEEDILTSDEIQALKLSHSTPCLGNCDGVCEYENSRTLSKAVIRLVDSLIGTRKSGEQILRNSQSVNAMMNAERSRANKAEKELETYQDLIKCCFRLETNLNDTFYWGTSDYGDVDADDVPKIINIYNQYGFNTLIAYESIIRGHDPVEEMRKYLKPGYWEAKKLLEHLAASGEILWERWNDLEQDNKDIEEFGSKITWTNFESKKYSRLLIGKKPGTDGNYIIQKATLTNGISAIGRSVFQARERLTKKFHRLKG